MREVVGVREERLRLEGTRVRDWVLSVTAGEPGGVKGEGVRLAGRKMDWFLSGEIISTLY